MQTALVSEPYSSGFTGPIGGQVDFTGSPIGEYGLREGPELMGRLQGYIASQGGSMLPIASTAAALDVVRKFIDFHRGNEVWGQFQNSCFSKDYLTGESQ
ncbi:hypothetical protein QFC22_001310, partial [Naganishia vaughanmartiniae]